MDSQERLVGEPIPSLLDDLGTVDKAAWDASWGANNTEEVRAAYERLVAGIEQVDALRKIARSILPKQSDQDVCLCGGCQALLAWLAKNDWPYVEEHAMYRTLYTMLELGLIERFRC